MSEPRRRPQDHALPSFVWLLLGLLAIAVFVLILGLLHPAG
jgi:hypothetical protein